MVLVSDGKETCQRDPCELVRDLRAQGIHVKVHVVGFDVTQEEKQQLVCIAEAGGGRYFTAQNAQDLNAALSEVKEEVTKKVETNVTATEAAPKKVIKFRASVGTIILRNSKDNADIIDQASGEKKGFVAPYHATEQIPVGTYRLKFPNFVIEDVKVGPGEEVVIDLEQ